MDSKQAIEQVLSLEPTDSKQQFVLEGLADASRGDLDVRSRLAKPDVLDKLVRVTETFDYNEKHQGHRFATCHAALRCIGNAVIDNDAARAHFANEIKFGWAERLFDDQSLDDDDLHHNDTIVKVLHNICVSSTEALQACCRSSRCFEKLISILRGHTPATLVYKRRGEGENLTARLGYVPYLSSDVMPLMFDLLFQLGNQQNEMGELARLNQTQMNYLLDFPMYHNMWADWGQFPLPIQAEDWASLLSTVLLYARSEDWQHKIVDWNQEDCLWEILWWNKFFIDLLEEAGDAAEDVRLLAPLSASLAWCLSDIASSEKFNEKHSLDGEPRTRMWSGSFDAIRWLGAETPHQQTSATTSTEEQKEGQKKKNEGQEQYESAACQVLGNMIWKQPLAASQNWLGKLEELYKPLLEGMFGTSNADLMHSASGLLCYLAALTTSTAERIGADSNALPALQKLCSHEMPQIKSDGVRLLRALGKGSLLNRERFGGLAEHVSNENGSSTGNNRLPEESAS